jgi:hypothetical protein
MPVAVTLQCGAAVVDASALPAPEDELPPQAAVAVMAGRSKRVERRMMFKMPWLAAP